MQKDRIKVSIIIVNYRVEKELIACIFSILNSKQKVSCEIIIVDNDGKNNLKKILKDKFPQVRYIKSSKNIGYGAGNNLGAKISQGEYFLFLNPDTIVRGDSIWTLYDFAKNNSKAGMVAPLLSDLNGKVYPYQGSDAYNLVNAVVVLSFVNKILSNNPISVKFFHKNWNKKNIEEFDVVPGTAFMIKKDVFVKAGKFDEKLFLYFEEYDLAKRIKQLGYKNYILPKSKILHIWEASTKKRTDIKKIFSESRFYFFKKNYGLITALLVNFFSSVGKYDLLLTFILGFSVFLGLYKIREFMVFIGDQGWFYLSAKDMLTTDQIPLVGIASSRPWLHQGPFWTYILAFFMWMFSFDPVAGAYASILFGIMSIVGIYIVGSSIFSKRIGLISALLYATSPLAVFYMRLPYHTSPIPIFVIAFIYSLYKIINNKTIHIPIVLFLLGVLYNFEIATVALWPALVAVVGYKIVKNKNYSKLLFNKKILVASIVSVVIPLLPMILYDVKNGFPQTVKFTAWLFYRAISLVGYNPEHAISIEKIIIMFDFLTTGFTKLMFGLSSTLSILIFTALMIGVVSYLFVEKRKKSSYNLLIFLFFIPLCVITLNLTPSDAYLPILFPITILLVSVFLNKLIEVKKMLLLVVIFLAIVVFGNLYFIFKNDFILDRSSGHLFTLGKRIQAAESILKHTLDKDYNLIGKGPGSKYESFTMNYEYLTWWLGRGPAKEEKSLDIYVSESKNGIKIERQ